ncbi:MAG: fumarate hydratase C-terminal domain-containing protein, partial [Treponema sp.]|nr:fumarate hydratase C-terminal domain-containing protein [Treponema sp.]
LSPEQNLLTVKLATTGAYDDLTYEPNDTAFRDRELEELVMKTASETGFGAQFGGTQFAVNAVVIRLSRHGASCPISFGVSCSAHRNLKAVLTEKGFYLEKTVSDPMQIKGIEKAVSSLDDNKESSDVHINTDSGIKAVLEGLKNLRPGNRILLSGNILVARDQAHARWKQMIDGGKDLPEYCTKYPVCYAGPARTPEGKVIGSFGPTTAGRMDSYADMLMSRGAALVTLAKGNRSEYWRDSCRKYGAFYLGTPGGIAALIASDYIREQKIIDFEDLGMEAVRLVKVENLPCFVITDCKGNDFYAGDALNGK